MVFYLPEFRKTAQSTSGRSSSQVTFPSVNFSISGQRFAGTWRLPFTQNETIGIATSMALANREISPHLDFSMYSCNCIS